MNESSGRNKSTLITAAGVIIFLAAGIFTMLFFPEREKTQQNLISNSKSQLAASNLSLSSEIKPEEARQEIKIEIPKPKSDWFVHVAGEVKNPGIYKVSADSRIFQAIEAAGGFTEKADQASVNMASKLTDGLQINVLAKGAKKNQDINIPARIPGMQASSNNPIVIHQRQSQTRTVAPKTDNGQININSASAKELERLNGVGPAIAKRIIEYRNKNGNFSSPEDLLKVKGIGKAKLEKMRSQVLIR
ncbi:MAG: helix-hairpin-helix domain-containing protein [Synergistaceae bacterium]|nr:helix-hairpin-helix domain-containing protein [Synergistaceae bacterium]